MAFQLSPGVLVKETDLTSVVPAVSSTAGGFVGSFQWGPVNQVVLIDSENTLVERFKEPNDDTFKSFFTAANFLAYGNNLQVIRSVDESVARNSVGNVDISGAIVIKNQTHYENSYEDGSADVGIVAAKYPGELGNSIRVSMADANTFPTWAYRELFDDEPGTSEYVNNLNGSNDELHIIVIDENGLWTGVPGSILEKHQYVSKASDAKQPDGTSIFYKEVLNNRSKFLWWMDYPVGVTNWGTKALNKTFEDQPTQIDIVLSGGASGDEPTDGNVQNSMSLFANAEKYDISLLPLGDASASTIIYAINNIAESRKDTVVFLSPPLNTVFDNEGDEAFDVVSFRETLPSSSYAFMDSGWKYQYDRYNDVYRWVPLNGDTCGCTVHTDFVTDPWFSPAGFNRGQIKNVVRLAFSPGGSAIGTNTAERDVLYKKGVNPVVSFPGQGTVLFGDKTLLSKPSAFDRINVRRLFIILEKAIATASQYQLFEFNDEFTRAQFRNLVEPFLRDVRGRRGIIDFKVVCDENNNSPEVIDRNEFIADIYIKPSRSINFIQLNFIATRTGIAFEEVGA